MIRDLNLADNQPRATVARGAVKPPVESLYTEGRNSAGGILQDAAYFLAVAILALATLIAIANVLNLSGCTSRPDLALPVAEIPEAYR